MPALGPQWMTAGSGIIHSEDVRTKGKVRLLQLWLTLPKNKRWIAPDFQTININQVPVRRAGKWPLLRIRVYRAVPRPALGQARET